MDKYEQLRNEVKDFLDESDQVIQEIDGFHCGDIVKLLYSCSERLSGVYTSPGNKEMSHDEKRIMARNMINKCMDEIIDVSRIGLTYTADSTTMLMLRERADKLSTSSVSGPGLEQSLKHFGEDIKNLADYVSNARDLNINGDSDLGDVPVYDSEDVDSKCLNCSGNCKE